jgi:hypothetical protein
MRIRVGSDLRAQRWKLVHETVWGGSFASCFLHRSRDMIDWQFFCRAETLLMNCRSDQEVPRIVSVDQAEAGTVWRHLDVEDPPAAGAATQACCTTAVCAQRRDREGITREGEVPATDRVSG